MSDSTGGGHQDDLLDLAFDPSGANLPPPLRPPLLSQSQIHAALQLGFSDKCIPSGGVGNGRGNPYYQPQSDFGPNYSPGGSGGPDYFQGGQYPQGDCVDGPMGHYGQEVEQEGLLPNLRRPDVNQIPPDVLAVLIKTGRFQEILGQDQRQTGQPHPGNMMPDSQTLQDSRMPARNVSSSPNNRFSPSQQQQQQDRHYASTPPHQHQQQPQGQGRNYSSNSTPPHHQSQERNYSSPRQHHPQSPDPRYSESSPQQRPPAQDRNYPGPSPQRHQTPPQVQSPGPPPQGFRTPQGNQGMKLSPFAKEFRPSAPPPTNMGMMNFQEESELAQAVAQIQMLNSNQANTIDFSQGPYSTSSPSSGNEVDSNVDNMDCILSVVTDAITDLTLHPANFSRCSKTITDVLKTYLNDVDTLGVVVNLLVEQSISNPNFSYSGARLSEVLHKSGVAVGTSTFKNFLLSQCQHEFQHCITHISDPAFHIRCRGLLVFFGELYVNIRIEKASGTAIPISIFGLGVIEMMQRLVKESEISHENVKCVFQVLKLVGWELQNSSDPKVRGEFENLVKDLSYIKSVPHPSMKPQTILLLESLFELMKKQWNRVESTEESPKTPVASPASSTYGANNVYEMPESDEEDYYESAVMLDDEPVEVQLAFDEFLMNMGKTK